MGWVSSAIGAVGGIVGSLLGSNSASAAVAANNEFQAKEAQKQRDWQEKMANTAHQREVSDLRTAGLNPILSATGGSGAATPVGAMPITSAYTGQAQDITSGLNAGVNFMNARTSAKAQKAQEALISEQMSSLQAQTYKTRAEGDAAVAAAEVARARNAIELANMIGLGNYTRAQTEYVAGPLSQKTNAEIPYIESGTLLNNAQRGRIIMMTPYEIDRLSAETGNIIADTEHKFTEMQLNRMKYVSEQVYQNKMTQETAESIARQAGIEADTALTYINARIANMEAEKKAQASRYGGREPQTAYDYLLRSAQNIGDIIGALGSGIKFFK